MQGEFIFLNQNSYVKDGQRRAYASFADVQGNVLNFNASAVSATFPDPFSICSLTFEVQQFGNGKSAFLLEKFDVTGQLVAKK